MKRLKKTLSLAIAALLLCMTLPLSASAASASASLTGPGTVRTGDTITLVFNLNGSSISGASGSLSYDNNQLTMTGTSQKIAAPWVVEFNGNNFVAYDNNLTSPINSNKELFAVVFKVNAGAGSSITVSYANIVASDGKTDSNIGTVSYSTTVAQPLSGSNDLASLTVSNATISPAFSKNTTSYTASVPFDISKLDVSAAAEDSKSKVSINSPALKANASTDVTVTVTAETGAKKTYTIRVTRAQDPNYVPSSNANLSGITVEGFLLSPVFQADLTSYVVWLPYETTSVKVTGSAQDGKAQGVEVVGGETLLAGQDNPVKVLCTAENGSKKEYTVIVKRAAAHDGSVDTKPTIAPPETDGTEETTEPTELARPTNANASGTPLWLTVILIVVALGGGFGGGWYTKNYLENKRSTWGITQ